MAKSKMNKSGCGCLQSELTDAIRKKARELYEKSGRKQGRDTENWLEAERIVKSQLSK